MYLATICLSGCGGCESSLLSVGEPLVALLSGNSVSFSSLLFDKQGLSPTDVVLVSGAVRNPLEEDLAVEVARLSRKMIALGTCAVYGGVAGLNRTQPGVYESMREDLPKVAESARPLDSVATVELYIPGCPPPPAIIFETLKSLVEGRQPERYETTVCSDCKRRVSRSGRTLRLHPGHDVAPGTCLLTEGLLCLGPVTRGGCGASCPSVGAVCMGCRGPSDMVLSSQLHSQFSDMVSFISRTHGSRPEKVEKQLMSLLKVIYMYNAADPTSRSQVRGRARLA